MPPMTMLSSKADKTFTQIMNTENKITLFKDPKVLDKHPFLGIIHPVSGTFMQ